MSTEKIKTNSAEETRKVAAKFAWQILRHKPGKRAVVLELKGELGSGKTTFLQGFARGLGIKEKILSPTFILMKKFQIPSSKLSYFYHIDCYRLKKEKDLESLGFKEIIKNPENIIAIEWPEKIKKSLPKNIIKIKFRHSTENQRTLTIIF